MATTPNFSQPAIFSEVATPTAPDSGYLKVYAKSGALCSIADGGSEKTYAASSDLSSYLPLAGGTLTGDLLFTDATYDIGKSGATRPRDGWFSRTLNVGTGATILDYTASGYGYALLFNGSNSGIENGQGAGLGLLLRGNTVCLASSNLRSLYASNNLVLGQTDGPYVQVGGAGVASTNTTYNRISTHSSDGLHVFNHTLTSAANLAVYETWTSSTSFGRIQIKANAGAAYQIGSAVGSAGGSNQAIKFGHWNTAGAFVGTACITTAGTYGGRFSDNGGTTDGERFGADSQVLADESLAVGRYAIAGSQYATAIGKSSYAGYFCTSLGRCAGTSGTSGGYPGAPGFNYCIVISDGTDFVPPTANSQLLIAGLWTEAYFGKKVTHATPLDVRFNATGGSGTNIAGASFTLAGGKGTGTGVGGSLIFQTAPAGSSGSSLNSLVTRLTIDSTGLATFAGNMLASQNLYLAGSQVNLSSDGSYSIGFKRLTDPWLAMHLGSTHGGKLIFRGDLDYSGIGWSAAGDVFSASTLKAALVCDDSGIVAQRNGTNAQTLRVYNTYTSSTSLEAFQIRSDTGGPYLIGSLKGSAGGDNRAISIGHWDTIGAVSTVGLYVDTNGYVGVSGITPSHPLDTNGVARSHSLLVMGGASDIIQFGGTTSSYAAIKRNGTELECRLADDSTVTGLRTGSLTVESANVLIDRYGVTTSSVRFRKALGTFASPTQVTSGTVLGEFGGMSYHNSAAFHTSFGASVRFVAAEDATSTAQGTYVEFRTTALGASTPATRVRITSEGYTGFATTTPTGIVDINDSKIRIRTAKTPSSASDSGNAGEVCWDSSYIYVCVATDTWKRTALSTW